MSNRYELYDEDSPLQATVLNFVSRSDSEMDRVFHKVQVSSRLQEVDEEQFLFMEAGQGSAKEARSQGYRVPCGQITKVSSRLGRSPAQGLPAREVQHCFQVTQTPTSRFLVYEHVPEHFLYIHCVSIYVLICHMDLYILLDLYTIAGKASDHLYLYLQLHNQRVIYITQNRFNISHHTSYRTDFKHVLTRKTLRWCFPVVIK